MSDSPSTNLTPDDLFGCDELRLQPAIERVEPVPGASVPERARVPKAFQERPERSRAAKASGYRRNPHTSLYGIDSSIIRLSDTSLSNRIDRTTKDIEILPEVELLERDYKNIKSLQKFFRTFGYTAMMVVPLYLLTRFVHIAFFLNEDIAAKFPAFLQYSFWLIASTLLISAIFLAASDFFQILLHLQSDTLTESKAYPSDGS